MLVVDEIKFVKNPMWYIGRVKSTGGIVLLKDAVPKFVIITADEYDRLRRRK